MWSRMRRRPKVDRREEKNNESLPENEDLDFSKPDYLFEPGANHDYRQQGPYLICKSCEIEHAVWVGTDRLMVGVDGEGKPILKRR